MKKLLLTLGTVAAVAAPVASVIACGSEDTYNPLEISTADATKAATTVVQKIMKDTGYTIAMGPLANVVAFLNGIAPKYALSISGKESGKVTEPTDKTHGSDDFMVTLTGAPVEKLTGDEFSILKVNGSETLVHTDGAIKVNVGTELNTEDTMETNWGISNDDIKNVNALLFLQNNGNGADSTLEISKVVEFDGKLFSLGSNEKGVDSFMGNGYLHTFRVSKA